MKLHLQSSPDVLLNNQNRMRRSRSSNFYRRRATRRLAAQATGTCWSSTKDEKRPSRPEPPVMMSGRVRVNQESPAAPPEKAKATLKGPRTTLPPRTPVKARSKLLSKKN